MPAKFLTKFKKPRTPFERWFLHHHKSAAGFTLVELLIVIAIIGILSTVLLANYNSFGRRQEVKNTAAELKSELRKYQNFAISGHKNPDQSSTCDDTTTLESYSIAIDPSAVNPPDRYNVDVNCTPTLIDLVDGYPWSDNINLVELRHLDSAGADVGACISVKILFYPVNQGADIECPIGTTLNNTHAVVIRLSNTDSSATYDVIVSGSGEINDERVP
jgi:prepilin-type N-terminal cleavage/methylation domain-containing protein